MGGTLLAMLFRHPAPGDVPQLSDGGHRLVVRNCTPPGAEPIEPVGRNAGRDVPGIPPAGASAHWPRHEPVILTPTESSEPPPLAKSYPGNTPHAAASWGGPSMILPRQDGTEDSVVRHKIVDGDTLRGLAERYLGSAERWEEIYAANRNVLSSPELLPIGVELKIRSPK